MPMETIAYRLDDRLANPGDLFPFTGHIDLPSYELGGREFTLPQGLDYDLVLTNAGEGILVSGMVRGHVLGTCDRCLEPAEFDIAGEVNEYYLFSAPSDISSVLDDAGEDDEDWAEEGEDDFLLVEDDQLDLTDPLLSALLMDTPFVVLCKEDCKGLCPHCGQNLNEGSCDCESKAVEAKLEESPFAVLKNLKLSD